MQGGKENRKNEKASSDRDVAVIVLSMLAVMPTPASAGTARNVPEDYPTIPAPINEADVTKIPADDVRL